MTYVLAYQTIPTAKNPQGFRLNLDVDEVPSRRAHSELQEEEVKSAKPPTTKKNFTNRHSPQLPEFRGSLLNLKIEQVTAPRV